MPKNNLLNPLEQSTQREEKFVRDAGYIVYSSMVYDDICHIKRHQKTQQNTRLHCSDSKTAKYSVNRLILATPLFFVFYQCLPAVVASMHGCMPEIIT